MFFFARKNTRVPLVAGLAGLAVAVGGGIFGLKFLGTSTLAATYSLAASGTFLILIFVARRNFANFDFAQFGKF